MSVATHWRCNALIRLPTSQPRYLESHILVARFNESTTMIDLNPLTEWFTMWREIIPALIAAAKWVMDQVNRGDPR